MAGNLFSFNAESIEIDRSGWGASSNCVLGVTSSAYSYYQAMSLTSSAAGACLARSLVDEAPAVTAGTEYYAAVQVSPGTASLAFAVQIRWRDAAGTEIQTDATTITPPTGQWTRVTVIATAPAGAVTARVGLAPTATAAGQTWALDRLVLAPTSSATTTGNLIPYATADIEVDVSGWTVTAGAIAQSRDVVLSGGYALKATADGTADMVLTITQPVAGITPELGYVFTPCVYRSPGVTRIYQTRMEWLNSAGDVVRTRWQSWGGGSAQWLAGSAGDLAPDDAASVRLSVIVPDAPAGEVWYVDRVHFGIGGLTVRAAPIDGAGAAAVTVRGLSTGGPGWKWSLLRLVAGRPDQPVRGFSGDLVAQSVGGDIVVAEDYEAPLGTPVMWRIKLYNPTGSGSLTYLSDAITLPAETLDVWLVDPVLPARSTHATVQTLPDWQAAARQGVNDVRGRRAPVVISDVRQSRTGSLALITHTSDERDDLWWVLSSGNPLLIKWPPAWSEQDVYVSVGEAGEARLTEYAEVYDRAWTLALTEVDRPIGGLVGSATRTWQTVLDSGESWAVVLDAAETWLDVYTG
ncbi:hypothetical protein [Streptomyces silvensis]|uniref:CBM-cenC domain-containing protein n=1 Tax=Streptomyces silvensis TaxID=1765722 RepID=A0A0W7X7V7_9ACTN|nr:hypothetical protein [Streptomyces silvensis]KUF18864.1 hypothetical protein AT728_07470 [Streptomyces silvensis]